MSETEKQFILQKIKIEYYNKYLSLSSIGQILDATVDLAVPGYIQLTERDRVGNKTALLSKLK